jgi:hypothetical protein
LSSIDDKVSISTLNEVLNGEVSEEQIALLIARELEKEVATIRDGSTVDLEDIDGEVGSTRGTLLFATTVENGIVKARPLRIGTYGVQFSDGRTQELLELVLEKLISIDANLQNS